jgi:hypothetical protein
MKKMMLLVVVVLSVNVSRAQLIDWDKLNLDNILGKALNVKKGYAPKFSLGNLQIPKINKVAQIINLKNISTATKLFNTFKTGRTIYKVGAYAGTAMTTYSTIRNVVNNAKTQVDEELKKNLKPIIIGGVSTMVIGLVVKFITKKAAYKAVDAFNGVVKKKLKDILSFDAPQPSPYTQAGLALKLSL